MNTTDGLDARTPLTSRYADSPERAAEYLRLTVHALAREPARPDPVAYTVWYEHVSRRNAALSEDIGGLQRAGTAVDDAQAARLFRTHVLAGEERALQAAGAGIGPMLSKVAERVSATATDTRRFGDALDRWRDAVDAGEAVDPERCAAMQGDTQAMQASVASLQRQLEETRHEAERLRAELARSHEEALSDALTGLPNRRCFERRMAACLARAEPAHSLLLTDIDHFKRVNDSFGHLFGDQVLRSVAQGLRGCIGADQLVARVGGEEFAILVPAPLPQALALAERIRATVAGSRIRRRDGSTAGEVTVSLGVAARRPDESAQDWYDRADRALYAAKHGGRNRVEAAA